MILTGNSPVNHRLDMTRSPRINGRSPLRKRDANRPNARGCPLANAAVEITEKAHPARKVIEAHKAKLRARLVQMCTQMGAPEPGLLADQLFLLMEGAQVTIQTLGARGPARNIARAAKMLIDARLRT